MKEIVHSSISKNIGASSRDSICKNEHAINKNKKIDLPIVLLLIYSKKMGILKKRSRKCYEEIKKEIIIHFKTIEVILMEYRQLGRSGFKVPVLSFGTATFGGQGKVFQSLGGNQPK